MHALIYNDKHKGDTATVPRKIEARKKRRIHGPFSTICRHGSCNYCQRKTVKFTTTIVTKIISLFCSRFISIQKCTARKSRLFQPQMETRESAVDVWKRIQMVRKICEFETITASEICLANICLQSKNQLVVMS